MSLCGSPDTSGMNAAALSQANISNEQLAWAKQVYADTAPDRAAATARANRVSDAQLVALDKQTALTDDFANYNKTTFRPLEQGIVADANSFDTEAKREQLAGLAMGDTNQAFSNARDQAQRAQSRMGVDPNSGRALAMNNQIQMAQAAGLAGAANKARNQAETQGYARKMDAANLGRGLASAQATSAGIALNQGNAAVSNGMQGGNIVAQGNQIVNQGYAGAQSGLANSVNTYGQIAKTQDNSALWGALGQVGGAWMASDKNKKKNIKPTSAKKSLAAFKKMPVSNWNYKKGQGDGGNHTGPMAQDVRKGLGDSVAPGGKVIDMISMAGHTINAIKELDKRVAGLESGKRKSTNQGARHGK